jgi:hypothetical protein
MGLRKGQQRYLDRMRGSTLRPYLIRAVRLESGMSLTDLWSGEQLDITERTATHYARPGDTIFARIIVGPEGSYEVHGVLNYPSALMADFVEKLRADYLKAKKSKPDVSEVAFLKTQTPAIHRAWIDSFRPISRRTNVARASKTAAKSSILQLKITLHEVKPQVWRRILVPDTISLKVLADTIERAMGWIGYHLHEFEVDGVRYGVPDPDFPSDMRNERGVKLGDFGLEKGSKFKYDYDFGDGWRHTVLVEKLLERQSKIKYPACIAGRRACPPEDVGGPWGYARFLKAIGDPQHEDHEDMMTWSGQDFDPMFFDLEGTDADLRRRS